MGMKNQVPLTWDINPRKITNEGQLSKMKWKGQIMCIRQMAPFPHNSMRRDESCIHYLPSPFLSFPLLSSFIFSTHAQAPQPTPPPLSNAKAKILQ
jgi:hypothetical protein